MIKIEPAQTTRKLNKEFKQDSNPEFNYHNVPTQQIRVARYSIYASLVGRPVDKKSVELKDDVLKKINTSPHANQDNANMNKVVDGYNVLNQSASLPFLVIYLCTNLNINYIVYL